MTKLTHSIPIVFAIVPDPVGAGFATSLAKRRLPAIYGMQVFVVDGGLMAYAMSVPDQFRRAADYVDRILGGARPGDLPIQQPRDFQLVINMNTAMAQGLTFAPSTMLRANRVIE